MIGHHEWLESQLGICVLQEGVILASGDLVDTRVMVVTASSVVVVSVLLLLRCVGKDAMLVTAHV